MWLLFTFVAFFLEAITNYIDEYLTVKNRVPAELGVHRQVGAVVLISLLFSSVGAIVIASTGIEFVLPTEVYVYAVVSGLLAAFIFTSYLYLLHYYSAHEVVPLYLISAIWIFFFELLSGASFVNQGLLGVVVLLAGAYLIDVKRLTLKVPTKLLLLMVPISMIWALSIFFVKLGTEIVPVSEFSFWQFLTIGVVGIVMTLVVRSYREGLVRRMQIQGRQFMGLSTINEIIWQSSYFAANLAIALAPFALYVQALDGTKSIFLLGLLLLFPVSEDRNKVTPAQVIGILLVVLGTYLIAQ